MESFISIRPPSPLTHLPVHWSTGPGFQGTELVEVPGVSGFQGTEPVEVPGFSGFRVSGFAFKDQGSKLKTGIRHWPLAISEK